MFDVETNLRIGADYLRQMMAACQGDVRLALAAYNAGPGRVRSLLNRYCPDPGSWRYEAIEAHLPLITRRYVQKVLAYREAFAKEAGGIDDGHS